MSSLNNLGQPLRRDVDNVNDNVQGPGQLSRPDVNNVNDNGEDSPATPVSEAHSWVTHNDFEAHNDERVRLDDPAIARRSIFYLTDDARPPSSWKNQKESTGNISMHLTNIGIRSSDANIRKEKVRK